MNFIHRANRKDTIAALATPPGMGGIAIIRVSGDQAIHSVNQLVHSDLTQQASHTIALNKLFASNDKLLDIALVLVMHPPRSFTGEETVEIHCHGGHLVAKNVLEALFATGVRPAEPGEFSLRAFLNGKIDLAQAEAIQDLISARNENALQVAEGHLEGRLSQKIKDLQQRATDLCALFEAWVDFPEEGLEFCSFDEAIAQVEDLASKVRELIKTYLNGKIIHDGLSICILGAPNVGKSSFMNTLLGKERAIVSSIAGTTRDFVEDDLYLNGLHCRLIDTAGIRETEEEIEYQGIERSQRAMERADIILALLDATRPDDPEMLAPLQKIPKDKSVIIWNKIDIRTKKLPDLYQPHIVHLSAKTGEGIDSLSTAIDRLIWRETPLSKNEIMITNLRHKKELELAMHALEKVAEGLRNSLSAEFIALEMKEALLSFGSILGTDITEDILDSIFSRFCIGK